MKVVHLRGSFAIGWEEEIANLKAIGATLVKADPKTEDELIAVGHDADALIVLGEQITPRVIEHLDKAKIIVRSGVGYDVINVPAATARGIAVCYVPDYCTEEVANHALALLLAVNRKVVTLNELVRSGSWRGASLAPMGSLYGETAGIVGYGRIGRAMAHRCRALGMKVIVADPYVTQTDADDELVPLDKLVEQADYISVHCLLNDETRSLINEERLRRMKPTAIVVNTARGPIVHQPSIIKAVQEGWIAGAGLDVQENEPPKAGEALLSLPNVVLTPHSAYYTDASAVRLRQRVVQEVIDVLSGVRPRGLLNTEIWETSPRLRKG